MVLTVAPADDLVALAGLDPIGYREGFVAPYDRSGSTPQTAEAWARATIEQAPPAMRDGMRAFWPRVGIRLGAVGSTEHVHGWRILRNDPRAVVLGVESRLIGTIRIVLRDQGDALEWTMLIRYAGVAGRLAWACIGPWHRPFVRRLLAVVTASDRFDSRAAGGSVPAE